jgi:hypothetical protein
MARADHLLGLLAGHENVVPRTMAELAVARKGHAQDD